MFRRPSPVNPTGPIIAIAGGWGESPRCFRHLADTLHANGYRTLLLKSARWRDWKPSYDAVQRQAADINRQLDKLGEKVIGVAHSMSGVTMAIAAYNRPDQFESLVLTAPAGLLRQDSFFGLVSRLNKKVVLSIKSALKDRSLIRPTLVSLREGLIYFMLNPLRGLREASALAGYRTIWRIEALRERGIKVFVIVASQDPIYPPERIKQSKGRVDGWVELGGQHDLWFYPNQLAAAIHNFAASTEETATSTP